MALDPAFMPTALPRLDSTDIAGDRDDRKLPLRRRNPGALGSALVALLLGV
jgi:hypothetical protein